MSQFSNVLLAFGQTRTVPQRALDCGPGLGRLNQAYGSNQFNSWHLMIACNRASVIID